ncbi:hypothetical protein DH2020_013602 [Rehmannia glutinosa]|uniref:Myb/SANT-like domain-containing protein n=1 Tax=Rehmannia glutinosa TaxID=99300 RepID=A0ABR0X3U1_REHGL
MAHPYNVIQADYIYDLEWMEEADKLFISVLLDQQLLGNFKSGDNNAHALLIAQATVNKALNKNFDFGYCQQRLKVLHKRYHTFYWIKRKHGVRYEESTNTVSAPNWVWDEIIKKDEFGLAYQEVGDPNWAELKTLFGSEHSTAIPEDADIIDISSDGETEDIGNLDGLPKPNYQLNKVKISSSGSSRDRSFWDYLAQFGNEYASSSESSVNQPLQPVVDPKDYPGPSFY